MRSRRRRRTRTGRGGRNRLGQRRLRQRRRPPRLRATRQRRRWGTSVRSDGSRSGRRRCRCASSAPLRLPSLGARTAHPYEAGRGCRRRCCSHCSLRRRRRQASSSLVTHRLSWSSRLCRRCRRPGPASVRALTMRGCAGSSARRQRLFRCQTRSSCTCSPSSSRRSSSMRRSRCPLSSSTRRPACAATTQPSRLRFGLLCQATTALVPPVASHAMPMTHPWRAHRQLHPRPAGRVPRVPLARDPGDHRR